MNLPLHLFSGAKLISARREAERCLAFYSGHVYAQAIIDRDLALVDECEKMQSAAAGVSADIEIELERRGTSPS